jgi:hypothetical protein
MMQLTSVTTTKPFNKPSPITEVETIADGLRLNELNPATRYTQLPEKLSHDTGVSCCDKSLTDMEYVSRPWKLRGTKLRNFYLASTATEY